MVSEHHLSDDGQTEPGATLMPISMPVEPNERVEHHVSIGSVEAR